MCLVNRQQLLFHAYKRDTYLHINNQTYVSWLDTIAGGLIGEDIREVGDLTALALLKQNPVRRAQILVKQTGILAGIEEATWLLQQHDISVQTFYRDGEKIQGGDVLIAMEGKMADLLILERVVLNLLQRMSGIATATYDLTAKCAPLLIAATRKTPWGSLDNKAVAVGGGATHRLGLWESILIKDNHLVGLGIETVLRRAWLYRNKAVFIEIEVENSSQAVEAAETFMKLQNDTHDTPCIIMFDNFLVGTIKKTVELLKRKKLYDRVLLEASGGITLVNIINYKNLGVDVVSLGCLTHSASALDISMRVL